jgi:hypothetical protein
MSISDNGMNVGIHTGTSTSTSTSAHNDILPGRSQKGIAYKKNEEGNNADE